MRRVRVTVLGYDMFVVEISGAEHLMKYETRIADGNSRDTILRVEWAESGEKTLGTSQFVCAEINTVT
jgi:hypothetical protein